MKVRVSRRISIVAIGKGWGERERGEGRDAFREEEGVRGPSLLTFALGMRVFAVERGGEMLGESVERGPPARRVGGR